MRTVAFALLLAAFTTPARAADESNIVAVFPFDDQRKLDRADRSLLDELARTQAGKYLTPGGFLVLTNETQLQVLAKAGIDEEQVLKACEAATCSLGVAKALRARLFVAGKLVRTEAGGYQAILRVFDGATGTIVSSTDVLEGATLKELRKAFIAQLPAFFGVVLRKVGGDSVVSDGTRGGVGLSVSPEALVAYDAAMIAEKNALKDPDAAVRAWDAVVEVKDRNPYRDDAITRARSWRDFAAKNRELGAQERSDRENLVKVVSVERVSLEQKASLVEAFRNAYGPAAAASVIREVKPSAQRAELCQRLPPESASVAAKVTLVDEKDAAIPGDYVVLVDGREVGKPPLELKLATCAQALVVREKATGLETSVPLDLKDPAATIAAKLPRFLDRANQLHDRRTGLAWLKKEAVGTGRGFYGEAVSACEELSLDGRKWRLPTGAELATLVGRSDIGALNPTGLIGSTEPREYSNGPFLFVMDGSKMSFHDDDDEDGFTCVSYVLTDRPELPMPDNHAVVSAVSWELTFFEGYTPSYSYSLLSPVSGGLVFAIGMSPLALRNCGKSEYDKRNDEERPNKFADLFVRGMIGMREGEMTYGAEFGGFVRVLSWANPDSDATKWVNLDVGLAYFISDRGSNVVGILSLPIVPSEGLVFSLDFRVPLRDRGDEWSSGFGFSLGI